MDGMGLGPEAVVALHVGGAAGGPRRRRLTASRPGFAKLTEAARARVRHRERRPHRRPARRPSFARIGRPAVWHILHHHCHDPDGTPDREALAAGARDVAGQSTEHDPLLDDRTAVIERGRPSPTPSSACTPSTSAAGRRALGRTSPRTSSGRPGGRLHDRRAHAGRRRAQRQVHATREAFAEVMRERFSGGRGGMRTARARLLQPDARRAGAGVELFASSLL